MDHGDAAVPILRADGVALLIDTTGPVPRVLHWGADPGPLSEADLASLRLSSVPAGLNNSPDVPRVYTTWPSEADGWSGTPALRGHAQGAATTPHVRLTDAVTEVDPSGGGLITLTYADDVTRMAITQRFALDRFGVLTVDGELVRDADASTPYTVDSVLSFMPLPERATEILDFAGKWVRERSPQRGEVRFGTHRRRTHRGKPGHDAPYLVAVGEPGFGFRHGEVWATHLAWSGEGDYLVEKLTEAAGVHASVLGAGEALHPGEVILAAGERYTIPPALFVWSGSGLDELSHRLHRRLRARDRHPRGPRPLVLNTWEAVYFDHDVERLLPLVDAAHRLGVERVVLDDGWFHSRRDADAGLGDWVVDTDVWPDGLTPFVDAIRERGMEFGLWFEPEMVNLDSDLARQHPEWILGPAQGLGPTFRNQYVLDISRVDAYTHVLEQISALVDEYGIDFIKWDHNRDLHEAVSHTATGDRPAVRAQTQALYRMLDDLRERHPGLEIETCAGGGGRVDLGVLDHTDRLWPSDCNDPVERLVIERWTRLLVTPELIGSHVGAAESHTTWRVTDLSFRLITALFSHAGIEMDITKVTGEEWEVLARWASLYREWRGVAHTGRIVNADVADPNTVLQGVVAEDGAAAFFSWVRLATSGEGQVGRVRLPGLDAAARYAVRIREDLGAAKRHGGDPAWASAAVAAPVEFSGAVLGTVGLPMPTLNPQQAMLIELRRIE